MGFVGFVVCVDCLDEEVDASGIYVLVFPSHLLRGRGSGGISYSWTADSKGFGQRSWVAICLILQIWHIVLLFRGSRTYRWGLRRPIGSVRG